jgi:hypothetical protein
MIQHLIAAKKYRITVSQPTIYRLPMPKKSLNDVMSAAGIFSMSAICQVSLRCHPNRKNDSLFLAL